ncbi:hypothetical protein [Ferrimonas marina]|uniref:Uncharacterized protein n=1 Tax=Ferrimonas marina TaxID=299255 RepID=A0A1M5TVZ0_9GAMM|nr:hypothetical protein [Ferrimonas marina]SHH54889.1 hypothetical protein SAMN02745129_2298 [Ferrimonas marina]
MNHLTQRDITLKALGNAILRAAKEHGTDSDPEHEAGDLQDAVREALYLAPPTSVSELLDLMAQEEHLGEDWFTQHAQAKRDSLDLTKHHDNAEWAWGIVCTGAETKGGEDGLEAELDVLEAAFRAVTPLLKDEQAGALLEAMEDAYGLEDALEIELDD